MIKYRIIVINNCNNAISRVKEAHILVYIRYLPYLIKAEIIRGYMQVLGGLQLYLLLVKYRRYNCNISIFTIIICFCDFYFLLL